MTEKEIERRMCKMFDERGAWALKFVSPNLPGVPDRIVILPGGVVWFVELKTEIGRMSKIQKWVRDRLQKLNVNYRVIHGWDAAKDFVNEVLPNEI